MPPMRVLVTGAAGFIGFHVSKRLLERGDTVIGVDNFNAYYEVSLKESRTAILSEFDRFTCCRADIADRDAMTKLFEEHRPERVVNLGAQAGVRYSLENPHVYAEANLLGFINILEACRHHGVEHLVYASSSSVYGSNRKLPFSVADSVDHPVSLYAATKKANELMAHTYSHLFNLPTTGLRFFTVYGPWGRPDMAYYLFAKAIVEGRPINIFNHGKMRRDFTYVDDIVTGVVLTLDKIPQPDPLFSTTDPTPATSAGPYRVYNIGNHQSVELGYFVELLEQGLGKMAVKNLLPMQPGDVEETCADVEALMRDVGFRPDTPIEAGIERFLEWFRDYHGLPR